MADRLLSEYGCVHFDFQYVDFPRDVGDQWKKSYFACARFLRLPSVLKEFGLPVVVTDIDAYAIEDFSSKALSLIENYDFGLCAGVSSLKHYQPWIRVSAGLVIIKNTQRGCEFSDLICNYICNAFGWSYLDNNWGIDQSALWASLMYLNEKYGGQDFAKLQLKLLTTDQKGRY